METLLPLPPDLAAQDMHLERKVVSLGQTLYNQIEAFVRGRLQETRTLVGIWRVYGEWLHGEADCSNGGYLSKSESPQARVG